MSAGRASLSVHGRWLFALLSSAPLALLACGPNGVAARSTVGADAAGTDGSADTRPRGNSPVVPDGSSRDVAADAPGVTPAGDAALVDTAAPTGVEAGQVRVDAAVTDAGAPPAMDAARDGMPVPTMDARADAAPPKDTLPPDLAPPPAPITVVATADTYVRDGVSPEGVANRTMNFGTERFFDVKEASEAAFNREAFVRFMAPEAVTPTVEKAELRMNLQSYMNADDVVLAVHELAAAWSETTVTYATRPSRGAEIARVTVRGTTVREYALDVTAYVRKRLAAGQRQIEFALVSPQQSDEAIRGVSREAGATGPRLVFTP